MLDLTPTGRGFGLLVERMTAPPTTLDRLSLRETDEMLRWQTERLLALETARDGHVVHVRPELVAEIAFSDVQESPRYPAGVALRFARVKHHRPEKAAADADTLQAVMEIFRRQRE